MSGNNFPKYEMDINGWRGFVSFQNAVRACAKGEVMFGKNVLDLDFSIRPMTDDDRRKIIEAADKVRK
jgi:hypothetical protein